MPGGLHFGCSATAVSEMSVFSEIAFKLVSHLSNSLDRSDHSLAELNFS